MLAIALEDVCYIIDQARIFDADDEIMIAEDEDVSLPTDDAELELLTESEDDDPVYQQLAGAIDQLNEDAQIDLVTLTWIGRGDFSREEWDDARDQVASVRNRQMPGYLLGMPQLGDLLEEGLAAMGLSCADLESNR